MVSKREYLAGLNPPLAKFPSRGKFSKDAHAAIAKAEAEGMVFDDPAPVKSDKPKTVKVKADKPTVTVTKSNADPAAVRAWAKENGVTVSERGRVAETVKAQYEAAMAEAGTETVKAKAPGAGDVIATAPLLVSVDQKFVGKDDSGKEWSVGYKTACANSGASIGYCNEELHRVVVSDPRAGLVNVRKA